MSVYVRQPDGNIWAYPDGSRWYRCLFCGHRWFGYLVHPLCGRDGCAGDLHPDWRPDDPDGPLVSRPQEITQDVNGCRNAPAGLGNDSKPTSSAETEASATCAANPEPTQPTISNQ